MIATIPRHHTARSLVGTFAWLRADPVNRAVLPTTPFSEPMRLDAFHAWFMDRLHEKINRNTAPRGRKDCADWFMAAWRTARAVNTPRLRVYALSVPSEFRARLAHRLVTREDD